MTTSPLPRNRKGALEVATATARETGEILKACFQEEKQVQYKGRGNIVTEYILTESLPSRHPDT